jgi:hypothetical protein
VIVLARCASIRCQKKKKEEEEGEEEETTHTRSLCGACLNSVDILRVVVAIKPLLMVLLLVRVRVSAVTLMLAVRGMLRKRGLVSVCRADM